MTKTMNEKIYDFNEQIISYIWVIIKGGSKKKAVFCLMFLKKTSFNLQKQVSNIENNTFTSVMLFFKTY